MSAWLDRFSHTSPSASPGPSRPFSPGSPSRNSIQLARTRPGLQARSASVSLVSENPLPVAAKVAQPSSLRNQLSKSTTPDARDPVDALADILGISLEKKRGQDETINGVEGGVDNIEESAESIEFGGLSLHDFLDPDVPISDGAPEAYMYSSTYIDKCAWSSIAFRKYWLIVATIDETEKNKFEDLHKQIQVCHHPL